MPKKDLPVTYTPDELATILNRSVETIRRLIKEGKIPAAKIGGRYVVTEETLHRLLQGEISTDDK